MRWSLRSIAVGLSVLTASFIPVYAQSGKFVPLFDGKSLDGWVIENTTANNFSVKDGNLLVEGRQGWLRSARQYSNFVLKVEFRFLTEDADSGIFVRAPGPASNIFMRGWPSNAYQIQTRDITKNQTNNPLWIGNIYRHGVPQGETSFDAKAVQAAVKKTGDWQTFEIEVTGSTIVVKLNGAIVTRAANIVNPQGHIGIQGETGAVEYRSVEINEL